MSIIYSDSQIDRTSTAIIQTNGQVDASDAGHTRSCGNRPREVPL